MLKVWGRKNSSNVQKTMWAVGELGLAYERIDIGMEFGGNDEPAYRALNPNGWSRPSRTAISSCGNLIRSFVIWPHAMVPASLSRPICVAVLSLASGWIWQISSFQPAFTRVFWGLVRTPSEQRDPAAIAAAKTASIGAAKILDAALARNVYLAGNSFSMGDIPMGVFIYRFRALLPDRPSLPNLERWYAAIEERSAFQKHVSSVPLT